MKTEQSPKYGMFPAERSQSEMDACSRDQTTNGFLPAGVVQVPKDELQRFLKCKRVGNYLLGKTIGEGSFAKVKQGFHVLAGEKVAVKIIDKKKAHQDKYVSRNMRREAKIMQMVRHPHIVQLLEVVETEHRYYLITELAAGGDLMEYICYRRKLGELEVRKFIRQIVCAVNYLHQGGIIHRDLKVENLLLDEAFNIKIIDFGLSNTFHVRTSEGRSSAEHLRTQCGSPAYAAPEILGHKPYGPEVDVWSIGVNMFAMLTGKLPYTAEPFNITCLYNKMKRNDMNIIPEHLSTSCKHLIQRFLTFHPEKRITLEEALSHEWLQKGSDEIALPIRFPNYPRENDLNNSITQHMVNKMEFNQQEIVEAVTQNRATSVSTVYHLLCRKLNKFYIEHPGKMNAFKEARPNNCAPEKTTSIVETRTRSPATWRKTKELNFSEDNVQTVVSSLNGWDSKEKENIDEDLCKINVPACRARLSSPSREDLSEGNVPDSNEIDKVPDSPSTANVDSEPREDETNEKKERSCSLSSETGLEISRKISCNCSSAEVMNMNGRKLSFNLLSHISIESKSTAANETPRNTSLKTSSLNNVANHLLSETGSRVSLTRLDAIKHDDMGKEHNVKPSSKPRPKEMSIGKVSPFNARIISIPLTPVKRNSVDKQNSRFRRFSFPHTSLPSSGRSKSLETSHQPPLSPFSLNSSTGSSPTSEKRTLGLSFPPYGLCCQLTGVKHRDVGSVEHCEDRKPNAVHQKHPREVSGGQELLTNINNTLGRLVELSEAETSTSKDSLLLRSRLPRSVLNAASESGEVIKFFKTALLPGNIGVERTKEKKSKCLKISCSVKDSHSKISTILPNPVRATSFDSKQQMHVQNIEKGKTKEKDTRKRSMRTRENRNRRTGPRNQHFNDVNTL